MRLPSRAAAFFIVFSIAVLSSCVGVQADIVLNADGSGRMTLAYRVSRQFEAVGALDGNSRWPGVPVGQADFERSIARLPALRLISFSAKEDSQNALSTAVVGFSRLEDILPLLYNDGEGATLTQQGSTQTLRLRLSPGTGSLDPQLLALAEQAAQGYDIAISLSAPAGAELRFSPETPAADGAWRVEKSGKKASFSIPLFRLISRDKPLYAEFVF
jgi:hypothetical protein